MQMDALYVEVDFVYVVFNWVPKLMRFSLFLEIHEFYLAMLICVIFPFWQELDKPCLCFRLKSFIDQVPLKMINLIVFLFIPCQTLVYVVSPK